MPRDHYLHELFNSPIAWIGDFRCRPRQRHCGGEEHSIGDEIAFVRRGAFVKHVGRHERCANSNHVVFFRRGEGYRISHPVDGGDDCTVLSLNPELLRFVVSASDPAVADGDDPLNRLEDGPCGSRLHYAQARLVRQLKSGSAADLDVEEQALGLVDSAVRAAYRARGLRTEARRSDSRRAHVDVVEAAKRVLSSRYAEPLPLDRLASAVHVSPFHLCRLFRSYTGYSIRAYRVQLRLRASVIWLAEGGKDITRLALELGFSDHSHFTHAFRRAFGECPARFRRDEARSVAQEMSKKLQVG